jgi:hypothetical protein
MNMDSHIKRSRRATGQRTEHGPFPVLTGRQRSGSLQPDGRFSGPFENPHLAEASPVRTDPKNPAIFVVDRRVGGPFWYEPRPSNLGDRLTAVTSLG